MEYAVVVERTKANLSALVPDLPGCVATGESEEAIRENIRAAIRMHIDGMIEDHIEVPPPSTIRDERRDLGPRWKCPVKEHDSPSIGIKKCGAAVFPIWVSRAHTRCARIGDLAYHCLKLRTVGQIQYEQGFFARHMFFPNKLPSRKL